MSAVVATGLLNYDADDRTTLDTYDANGNTVQIGGTGNVYDFENRLVQRGGVSIVYDGDGNRVQETVAGVTTRYLVGEVNPTGYVQVLAELSSTGSVLRGYAWGMQLEAQRDFTVNPNGVSHYYGYDGHGSVRFLADSTGAITDTYDYDAFGNVISQSGSTVNNYMFAGEQFDPALGIYYNRARYYDQRQGRFWTMDTYEGDPFEAAVLHRYLYASNDPIDRIDPSGLEDLNTITVAEGISEKLDSAIAHSEQQLGKKAIRMTVCEVGKCIVDLGIQEGVYLFMEEIAPGVVVPYVGQTKDLIARIATQVRNGKIFERVLAFIEVEGGLQARRLAEQKIIQVLTRGLGLLPGVRSLPTVERLISNLRNEIRLDKFINICK